MIIFDGDLFVVGEQLKLIFSLPSKPKNENILIKVGVRLPTMLQLKAKPTK